jgi:hypothetical protein
LLQKTHRQAVYFFLYNNSIFFLNILHSILHV